MTTEEARQYRQRHDRDVRMLNRRTATQLRGVYKAELTNRGVLLVSGGPMRKDELVSAIISEWYPLAKLNETTHVLYHTDWKSDVCEQCAMSQCYSPGLEHNRCQAGHPIHFDTTGRYEADTWVHCSIADVVRCPHDSEQILDVRPGKHRVQP